MPYRPVLAGRDCNWKTDVEEVDSRTEIVVKVRQSNSAVVFSHPKEIASNVLPRRTSLDSGKMKFAAEPNQLNSVSKEACST